MHPTKNWFHKTSFSCFVHHWRASWNQIVRELSKWADLEREIFANKN